MATIKGEYWIIDGSVNYADGDVGDTNHEGYALDHLRRKVLDAVGIDAGDMYDWDEEIKKIPEALNETLDLGLEDFVEDPEAGDVADELGKFAKALDLPPGDIDQAFESAVQDVRDYMAENYGWICCHRDRFATWFLTRDALETIAEAAGEILDQEGHYEDLEDDGFDFEIEVFVVSSNKTYEVSWRALERGDFSTMPMQETLPAPGPNAQVAAMDRELEHPYYRNK